MSRAKIILTMIVKNEAEVLPRLFASIPKHLYDAVVVVDTGSTDETKRIIRECSQRPVEITTQLINPFHFGDARTAALDEAREFVRREAWGFAGQHTYALMVDADETFNPAPGFRWPENMVDPAYVLQHFDGNFAFTMMNLFRLDLPWRYEGVIHEHPVLDGFDAKAQSLTGIAGIDIIAGHDGARSKGVSTQEKYLRDADVLMSQIKPRDVYYLAQSFKAGGHLHDARIWYKAYLTMGDDDREQHFLAELNIAAITGILGENPSMRYHQLIIEYPHRAEPLRYFAEYLRANGRPAAAAAYDEKADAIPLPTATNLVDLSAYRRMT